MNSSSKALFSCVILLVVISLTTIPTAKPVIRKDNFSDRALWQNVIDRMRQGQSYYESMEMALRTVSNYPLRPFWSFRLPTLASFIALFRTNLIPRIVLVILAVFMVFLWLRILYRDGGWLSVIVGIPLLSISIIYACVPKGVIWHDVWSGILIAISLGLYSDHPRWSIFAAGVAVSLRIHVILFVFVMTGFALWNRQYRELIAWSIVILFFFCYVGLHAWFVSRHVTAEDPSKSWLAFGGWPFVIATNRVTLLGISGWTRLSGALLPLGLLSLFFWDNPIAGRVALTMLGYVIAFMIVGNPDNGYWGLLYSPLWAIGVACVPAVLKSRAAPSRFFLRNCWGRGRRD